MAVAINNNGDVVITLKNDGFTGLEKLDQQRQAVYDALCARNEEFANVNVVFGLVDFLKETDPSLEQWNIMVEKSTEN